MQLVDATSIRPSILRDPEENENTDQPPLEPWQPLPPVTPRDGSVAWANYDAVTERRRAQAAIRAARARRPRGSAGAPMITVTITRAALVRAGACAEGLALHAEIAAHWAARRKLAGLSAPPGRASVRWTPLAQVWLAVAHPGFARWLYECGLVPAVSLRGADLRGADLGGAYLGGAYLRGADLRGAYLRGADLGGAYLRGADLRGADLGGAYLRGADLRGADLGGADLGGADRWASDPPVNGWYVVNGVMVSA